MAEDSKQEIDEKVSSEENAEEVEEGVELDHGPPPAQDFGKVVYVKKGEGELTEDDEAQIRDANIMIEDQELPVIVKNQAGIAGVVASEEIIEYAEVIE
jgi:hypothetical protein